MSNSGTNNGNSSFSILLQTLTCDPLLANAHEINRKESQKALHYLISQTVYQDKKSFAAQGREAGGDNANSSNLLN